MYRKGFECGCHVALHQGVGAEPQEHNVMCTCQRDEQSSRYVHHQCDSCTICRHTPPSVPGVVHHKYYAEVSPMIGLRLI
jgi:hypothetical protein